MNRKDIATYFDKYCRFKLRSGKEVYGVIWENAQGEMVEHYFASAVERDKFKHAEQVNDIDTCEKIKTPVNIDEIIDAQQLDY